MTPHAKSPQRVYVVIANDAIARSIAGLLRSVIGTHFEVSILDNVQNIPSGRYVVLVGDDLDAGEAVRMTREVTGAGNACLVVATRPIDAAAARLLFAGASGFLYEAGLQGDALASAVEAVARGSAVLHADAAATLLEEWRQSRQRGTGPAPDLSARELEVLEMIADGATTRQMAKRLVLSEKTVEAHRTRLYAKLGARNQAHAISLASGAGLLKQKGAAVRNDRSAF